MTIKKKHQRIGELEEDIVGCKRTHQTLQETIDDLRKLNQETVEMNRSLLAQKESEIAALKRDFESQSRMYSSFNETKFHMKEELSKKDLEIERLKSTIEINEARNAPAKPKECHWVIESNLRDIISEHKQKLITEKARREKLEHEVAMYSEMLVKTKVRFYMDLGSIYGIIG